MNAYVFALPMKWDVTTHESLTPPMRLRCFERIAYCVRDMVGIARRLGCVIVFTDPAAVSGHLLPILP